MPGVSSMESDKRIYLDYAATTPLDPRVLEAMMPFLASSFGNASALYAEGKEASLAVEESRRVIAGCVGVRNPHEIVFTSGGTESDNTAVKGIAHALRDVRGRVAGPGHVICSSYEHKAVLESVAALRHDGFETSLVSPREDGFVHPDDIRTAMRPDTLLVSVMAANNEIGTVNPVAELAAAAHDGGALFHTDAVAAVGKVPVALDGMGVDAASFTAHKMCGPKGVGALYLSRKARLRPLLNGGGQEKGRRSGTYDTASIVGFAKAMELACGDGIRAEAERLTALRDRFIARICSEGSGIRTALPIPAGDGDRHLPGLIPLIFKGNESETLVMKLDNAGFAVSGGSACNAAAAKASHVLLSIGFSEQEASGFLRITFGRFTEACELEALAQALESLLG